MMKLIISCIWICCVALASSYVVASWKAQQKDVATNAKESTGKVETKKTSPLNVPMIRNGNVEGYIVVQLNYTIDANSLSQLGPSSELYIQDEAFRSLYADQIDLEHLEKYDLLEFTKHLQSAVNLRLGIEAIKAILIEQFNFIPKRELPR